jgi:hypothetical protein
MGRGWHHGKRVGARMRGFSIALALLIGRARVLLGSPLKLMKTRVTLIRHGQTEFTVPCCGST